MARRRSILPGHPISMSCPQPARRCCGIWIRTQHAGPDGSVAAVQLGAGGPAGSAERHAGGAAERTGQRLHQRRSPDPRQCSGGAAGLLRLQCRADAVERGTAGAPQPGHAASWWWKTGRCSRPWSSCATRGGAVALAVFLGPAGSAELDGLPEGQLSHGVRHRRVVEPSVQHFRGGDAGDADGCERSVSRTMRLWWCRPMPDVPDAQTISDQEFERN